MDKYNPYSHFYLYAKGWYKESDDIIDDLKSVIVSYTGCKKEWVGINDVFFFLKKLAEKHISAGHYSFFDFIEKLNPNGLDERLKKNHDENYEYNFNKSLARACLSTLTYLNKDQIVGELKDPDENVLPMIEGAKERWMEIHKTKESEGI